ncbi:MAG: DUF4350 domain-containing protein [Bryobacteraceae bacterium]
MRRQWRLRAAFWLGVALAAGGAIWTAWPIPGVDPDYRPHVQRPAYGRRGPHVLIDEAHGNSHTGGGRYRPLAELLSRDGYRVARNRQRLIPELLESQAVLVVATPRERFGRGELAALETWVAHGGGLLVTGEAPNLTQMFGIRSGGDPRPAGPWHAHPIFNGRPERGEEVLRIHVATGPAVEGGEPLVQGRVAVVVHGKGRVVVVGDADLLGAKFEKGGTRGLNEHGFDHPRFALNALHWLSGALGARSRI